MQAPQPSGCVLRAVPPAPTCPDPRQECIQQVGSHAPGVPVVLHEDSVLPRPVCAAHQQVQGGRRQSTCVVTWYTLAGMLVHLASWAELSHA